MVHNLIETIIYLVFSIWCLLFFKHLNQALNYYPNLWDLNYCSYLWELITLSSGALNPSMVVGFRLELPLLGKGRKQISI